MAQSLILLESGRADRLGSTTKGRPPRADRRSLRSRHEASLHTDRREGAASRTRARQSSLGDAVAGVGCVQGPRTAELSRRRRRGSGLVACGFGLCAKVRTRMPRRPWGPRIRLRAAGALLRVRQDAGALPSPQGGHRGGCLIGRGGPGLFESTFPFVGIAPSPAGRSIRAFRNPHSGAARGGAATAVVAGAPDGIPRLGAGRGRRPGDGFRPRGFGSPLSAGIASCWCRWLRHSP